MSDADEPTPNVPVVEIQNPASHIQIEFRDEWMDCNGFMTGALEEIHNYSPSVKSLYGVIPARWLPEEPSDSSAPAPSFRITRAGIRQQLYSQIGSVDATTSFKWVACTADINHNKIYVNLGWEHRAGRNVLQMLQLWEPYLIDGEVCWELMRKLVYYVHKVRGVKPMLYDALAKLSDAVRQSLADHTAKKLWDNLSERALAPAMATVKDHADRARQNDDLRNSMLMSYVRHMNRDGYRYVSGWSFERVMLSRLKTEPREELAIRDALETIRMNFEYHRANDLRKIDVMIGVFNPLAATLADKANEHMLDLSVTKDSDYVAATDVQVAIPT